MKSKLEAAIEVLAGKIQGNVRSDDALKYTQAALNLAHAIATTEANAREASRN